VGHSQKRRRLVGHQAKSAMQANRQAERGEVEAEERDGATLPTATRDPSAQEGIDDGDILREAQVALGGHPFGVPETDSPSRSVGANSGPANGGAHAPAPASVRRPRRPKLVRRLSTYEERVQIMVKRRREREEQEEESNRGNTPAKAWFYPSLFWGLPPNVHTRQDGAKALQAWDVIIAVACLYQGFMVPFSLCFEKLYLTAGSDANTSEQCLFAPNVAIHPDAPFFISRYVDVVVDFLFIVDIGLNFVSARWVLEVEPMEHWQLYDNISDISKLYVTDGSFALDFLGSLPVQYLNCIPVGSRKMTRYIRTPHMH
jgi:hypothetical protein